MWAVLRAHLRADPRKTGVLIVLVVVMAIVFARLYLKSSVPNEANASDGGGAVPSREGDTSGATDVTEREPATTPKRVVIPGHLPTELARNPFAVRLDRFPLAGGPTEPISTPSAEVVEGGPDEDIREAANELALQSTICGGFPLACINGQVVSQGQEIAGFVVKSIEPTRVVLWRGGTAVALNLR